MSLSVRSFCLMASVCLVVSMVSMWTLQPLGAFGVESWFTILILGGIGGVVGWFHARLSLGEGGSVFDDKAYNLLTIRQAIDGQLDQQDKIRTDIGEMADELADVVAMHSVNPLRVSDEEDQNRREMVSRLSHELRTPLSGICAYTELLLDGEIDDDEKEREKCYEVIHSQAHRLQHLIDTLMMLSSIDHRLIEPVPERVNPTDLVKDIVSSQSESIDKRGIKLNVSYDEGLAWEGDRELLRTCVRVLLDNALSRSKTGDEIAVRTRLGERGEMGIIEVQDSGDGIETDDLKRVFDAFYYVGNGDEAYCSGLNLNLVKRIIEVLHKGKVGVSSDWDEGTTFRIELNQPKSVTT